MTTIHQIPPSSSSPRRTPAVERRPQAWEPGVEEIGLLKVRGESPLPLVRGEKVQREYLPLWVRKLQEVPWRVPFHEDWLDHTGVSRFGEGEFFVSEPYNLESEAMCHLIEDAKRYGFDFHVSATSWHHPTKTIQILAWPR